MNNSLTGFLGTYASPESLGIYRFTIDLRNGAMSYPELYYEAPDCKFLSLKDSLLASP
jgi:6-phosphogluconolactonase